MKVILQTLDGLTYEDNINVALRNGCAVEDQLDYDCYIDRFFPATYEWSVNDKDKLIRQFGDLNFKRRYYYNGTERITGGRPIFKETLPTF